MEDNIIFWDKKIDINEVKMILKDELSPRFIEFAALLLSRINDPKQVFNNYLTKVMFCRNWKKIKIKMRKNKWNDNKIIFWDAVYEVAVKDIDKNSLKTKKDKVSDPEMKSIGQKIEETRKRKRWTQKELANQSKVSQQTISLAENGHTNISLRALKKITDALSLKIYIENEEKKLSNVDTYVY